jgi:hypothetical protein
MRQSKTRKKDTSVCGQNQAHASQKIGGPAVQSAPDRDELHDALLEKLGPVHEMAVDIALSVYGGKIAPATCVIALAMAIGFILACAESEDGWADESARKIVPNIVQRLLKEVPSDYLEQMSLAAALDDIDVAGNA